jgi:hypothetical protein
MIKQEEMSDEDVFVCFLVVALSSFLCSNTNLVPSVKYLGVFEDTENAKDYDWCGLVLSWLLGHIKAFNRSSSAPGSSKSRQSLGGCVYYLVVRFTTLFSPHFHCYSSIICCNVFFFCIMFCIFLILTNSMYIFFLFTR